MRIDLAGATLDIWPLYLYHAGAQTLNVAISLRARCWLRTRGDRRLVLHSLDTNLRVEADHWSELPRDPPWRLLRSILGATIEPHGSFKFNFDDPRTGFNDRWGRVAFLRRS